MARQPGVAAVRQLAQAVRRAAVVRAERRVARQPGVAAVRPLAQAVPQRAVDRVVQRRGHRSAVFPRRVVCQPDFQHAPDGCPGLVWMSLALVAVAQLARPGYFGAAADLEPPVQSGECPAAIVSSSEAVAACRPRHPALIFLWRSIQERAAAALSPRSVYPAAMPAGGHSQQALHPSRSFAAARSSPAAALRPCSALEHLPQQQRAAPVALARRPFAERQ